MGTKEEEARFPCLSSSLSWSLGVVVVGVLPAHRGCCGNYKKGNHGGHHQHQHCCCQYWRSRASLFCCAQTWRPSERIWATSREREREITAIVLVDVGVWLLNEHHYQLVEVVVVVMMMERALLRLLRSHALRASRVTSSSSLLQVCFFSLSLSLSLSLFLLFYYACPSFLPSSSGSMRRHGNSGWCILRAFSGDGGEGIDRM